MNANQAEMVARTEAKTDANIKEMEEAMRTNQGITDTALKEIITEVRAWRKETTTCHEATEACLESKEPTSVQMESVTVHEEAAGKTVRALKEQYGDRRLAVGRRRQLKKRSQGDGGSGRSYSITRCNVYNLKD
jgi:hypothetical protein